MRYIRLMILVIILLIVILFASLNAHFVVLHYFFGQVTVYFPILLFLFFFIGLFIGVLLSLPAYIKKDAKYREQSVKLNKMQIELRNLRKIPLKEELW
tara:strand:+ start:194 stop:487 length:294 start_codon:yes stop_codon:yes gene_type:complete